MKCPRCDGTSLTMSERQNVEIDYCPQCRGIWLDRGELDKLIERSEQADPSQYGSAPRANRASERMIERRKFADTQWRRAPIVEKNK